MSDTPRLPPHAIGLPDDTPLTIVVASNLAPWVLHLTMGTLRRLLKKDEDGNEE